MQNPKERFSGLDMWPGTDASYRNITPKYKLSFDKELVKNWKVKVDTMIKWLTNSSAPANCIFGYFDEPDQTSHEYGPFGDQTIEKVQQTDRIVGYLIERLNQTKLFNKTNLILLSDHGMVEVE